MTTILTLALATAAHAWTGPFTRAELAPPDTRMYVHVQDASGLRRQMDGRPMTAWINAILGGGQLGEAWVDLARRAGMTPEDLFDAFLGRSVTYLSRPSQGDPESRDWAVVTDVDPLVADAFQQRLRPRLCGRRNGVSVCELPEHALLLGRTGRTVLIGPRRGGRLFDELTSRIGADPAGDTLLGGELLDATASLGGGRLGVVVRHERPLGGWSAIAGDLSGRTVRLRHASRFANSPFTRRVTERTCDFSVVGAFEHSMLLAMDEPTDVGDGLVDAYLAMHLGQSLLSPELRELLGPVRVMAVGEEEGRLQPVPQDLLAPSIAVCLQVTDPEEAIARLDEQMEKLATRVQSMGRGAYSFDMADARGGCGDHVRGIDVSDATEWFTGFPIMRNVSLNWTVARGPDGDWCVIATHHGHLRDVVSCLERPHLETAGRERYDSVGFVKGRRVARQLSSWTPHVETFADPAEIETFRHGLALVTSFADGVDQCRWAMRRPDAQSVRLDVELKLSERESAGSP